MPLYQPIHSALAIKSSLSDMIALRWDKRRLSADFLVPDDEATVLRVDFAHALIVRIVDEMPLSTEAEPTRNEGLVADHLAYKVRGAIFSLNQSEAFHAVHPDAEHFRFITGWTCLDVIAAAPPTLTAAPRVR